MLNGDGDATIMLDEAPDIEIVIPTNPIARNL
jgi:hypothetical protein